jgi:hypothetical protein
MRRVAVALVALAVVGGLVAASMLSRSASLVDAEFARLRAAGLPATCAEVFGVPEPVAPPTGGAATTSVPPAAEPAAPSADDANGVHDVEAAFAWLESNCGKWGSWKVTGPWDPDTVDPWPESATTEQLAALRRFLTKARPFFDRVDAGLAKPTFRFVPTFGADGLPSLDFVLVQQHLIQLLSARGAAAATAEERVAAMSASARLARRIPPTNLLCVMVALSSQSVAVCEARRAAEDGSIPAAELRRALDADLAASDLPLLPAAARGEAALIGTAWRAARAGTSTTFPRRPLWRRLARSFERMFDSSGPFDAVELSADEISNAMRYWADAASIDASSPQAFRTSIDQLAGRAPTDWRVSVTLLRQMETRILRSEAAARLARIALAAKAHREATGAWPASLEELAPALGGAVPTDPATDLPFDYAVGAKTVRLRAAGEPGTDDATLREQLLLWEFPR